MTRILQLLFYFSIVTSFLHLYDSNIVNEGVLYFSYIVEVLYLIMISISSVMWLLIKRLVTRCILDIERYKSERTKSLRELREINLAYEIYPPDEREEAIFSWIRGIEVTSMTILCLLGLYMNESFIGYIYFIILIPYIVLTDSLDFIKKEFNNKWHLING